MKPSFQDTFARLAPPPVRKPGLDPFENNILNAVKKKESFTIPMGTRFTPLLSHELVQKLSFENVKINLNDGTPEIACQITGITLTYIIGVDIKGTAKKFYFSEPESGSEAKSITISFPKTKSK